MSELCGGKCNDLVNEQLAKQGLRLVTSLTMAPAEQGGFQSRLVLATERIDGKKGKRGSAALTPAFCPFCGGRIEQGSQRKAG